MKAFYALALAVCLFSSSAMATAVDSELSEFSDLEEFESGARFFTNFTSSLIQINATILAYALIGIAIAAAIKIAIYYIWLESVNNNHNSGYGYQQQGYGQQSYGQGYGQYARSSNSGYEFNSLNIIQWISMLQDLYEKFDYNDLECQKRLICEVMKEPDYYGSTAQKFKAGFQYAKYLEVVSLPDDMRELLDEYLDANARADQNKDCNEFFTCPYSIKDSFKRNLSDNSL